MGTASETAPSARAAAVLFDVDGTLVDSNYLHVCAWVRAFTDAGFEVESSKIHRSIGMDGATLLDVLAPSADDDARLRLKEGHSAHYRECANLLKPLPGARELLREVAARGLQVVLATSAPEDELSILRRVLDCDDVVDETTSSQDVETAKPEPDIVRVALHRAGVTAGQAVFVGDAVWDIEACMRAEVASIGLLSGGVSRDELTAAGATAVFDNPRDLLDHIDATRIANLPTTLTGGRK